MKYKKQINPELKHIARKIPYNKVIIKCANIFQRISFHVTRIPKEVINRNITIKGYKGLKCKVEIFEPSNIREKLPCLIYVHGGAFSYRASAYHKKLACMYAMKVKCRVYFPDYHLTPKYPYPAAYEDVLALYKCIMEHSEEFGIDTEKIGVAGDSAGAAIAALICNNYEQENLKQPCIQMLVYPLTDVNMQTDSMKKFSDTPLWNSKNNKRMWYYYCRNLKVEDIYGASPMHSSLPHIIPDTYIETAEYDCLHDEGILYGKKLREAGANVYINETRGTIHGYDSALNTKIAVSNIEKRILFLKKGFHGGNVGMSIEYRKLKETDLDIFIEMRMQQLQEEGAEATFDLKPYLQDYYKRHLNDHTFVSWLAVEGEKIIGTSGMSFVEKPPYYSCPSGKIGLLSSMYVKKDFRRKGIARVLLDKVVNEAKDYGCATVQITASDMGVLLYTDYGFKKNDKFMYYTF